VVQAAYLVPVLVYSYVVQQMLLLYFDENEG
jgi:hypothetical protein